MEQALAQLPFQPDLPALIPEQILVFNPPGNWGISYDISTNPTERPVRSPDPDSPIGGTYKELITMLQDHEFDQHQYSDYRNDDTSGLFTFVVMLGLRAIRPPNKIATTLRSMKMHYINSLDIWDQSIQMRLGNIWSPNLEPDSIAPRALVETFGHFGQPLPENLQHFEPPIYTVRTPHSPEAFLSQNWVQPGPLGGDDDENDDDEDDDSDDDDEPEDDEMFE
ncbi:hypothetical protein DL93DRAFT_2096569 [Clavulina sp. PMI_390]|nr:hypothetical protein DL93DRAFT_2096569 [Clavulina sp. PMI_390]